MNCHPNGAGTILPGKKQVKPENQPGYAPPPPLPAEDIPSDKRIARLQMRRDDLMHVTVAARATASEVWLRGQLEELADTVGKLASLKARRNAIPVTPYTVTLDEHASRLVRSIMLDAPDLTVEDVVNGAVYFNADDDHDGSPECFEAARAARLGKEAN